MKLSTPLTNNRTLYFVAHKCARPRFRSNHRGRTWDTLFGMIINDEKIQVVCDTTWGTAHYFSYKGHYYKITQQYPVSIKNNETGEIEKGIIWYPFEGLGYNCVVKVEKE